LYSFNAKLSILSPVQRINLCSEGCGEAGFEGGTQDFDSHRAVNAAMKEVSIESWIISGRARPFV